MRLDIIVNGVLLTAGLGLAYWASKPADEDQDQKVDIINIEPTSIVSLKLTGADVNVDAAKRPNGERFWINHTRTEKPKEPAVVAPDPENPEGTAELPKTEPVPETAGATINEKLLSNEKFDELIKSFNPLKAERVIGTINEDQYKEFGLEGLKFKFEIVQDGGKSTHFFLGKKSYGLCRCILGYDALLELGHRFLVAWIAGCF